jgi:hypothetical protein
MWKITNPCIAAAVALQIVEFGHMVHECAPGAERARCDALPGQHTEDAPAPRGNVQLFGYQSMVTVTASTSIATVSWPPLA